MVKKTFDYKDAEEKLVNCTILYATESSAELFYDEAMEHLVDTEAYLDLFLAGIVIVRDGVYLRPTEFDGVNNIKAGEYEFGNR